MIRLSAEQPEWFSVILESLASMSALRDNPFFLVGDYMGDFDMLGESQMYGKSGIAGIGERRGLNSSSALCMVCM